MVFSKKLEKSRILLASVAGIMAAIFAICKYSTLFYCNFFYCAITKTNQDKSDEVRQTLQTNIRVASQIIYDPPTFLDCNNYVGFFIKRDNSYISLSDNHELQAGDKLYIYISGHDALVTPKFEIRFGSFDSKAAAASQIFEKVPFAKVPIGVRNECSVSNYDGTANYVYIGHLDLTERLPSGDYYSYYSAGNIDPTFGMAFHFD